MQRNWNRFRLDSYARKAELMIGPDEDDAQQHVLRYLNSVRDSHFTDTFIMMGLPDISTLADRIEGVERTAREV